VSIETVEPLSNVWEPHKWNDENGARRYKALSFTSLVNDVGINWPIIDNTLWSDAIHTIAGPANVGKSAIGLAAVLSLSQGLPLLDRENVDGKPSRVAVLIGEAPANVRNQTLAWAIHHDVEPADSDVVGVTAPIDFSDPNVAGGLGDWLCEEEIGVVLIDPLINFIGRGDENDSSHMAAVMRGIRTLSERMWRPNLVVLIHHANASGDLRGSRVIRDLSDVLYLAAEDGPKGVQLRRSKNRFGIKDDILRARLQRVVEKPNQVDSIVAISSQSGVRQPPRLSMSHLKAWDTIRDNSETKLFTKAELSKLFSDQGGIARASTYRAIEALVEAGYLIQSNAQGTAVYSIRGDS
jgi:hypothetical protein